MQISYELLKQALLRKGFTFFEGNFNLNLIGIRNANDPQANTFNDVFCVAYQDSGVSQLLEFNCTTDAGVYYRTHPANVNGTAILPLGQQRGMWKVGSHQGKYEALVQATPVKVIRDPNADAELDFSGATEQGMFGINCHRALPQGVTERVDNWSAGCQVIADANDFNRLMGLAKIAANRYGNSFTYTLLSSTDFE